MECWFLFNNENKSNTVIFSNHSHLITHFFWKTSTVLKTTACDCFSLRLNFFPPLVCHKYERSLNAMQISSESSLRIENAIDLRIKFSRNVISGLMKTTCLNISAALMCEFNLNWSKCPVSGKAAGFIRVLSIRCVHRPH